MRDGPLQPITVIFSAILVLEAALSLWLLAPSEGQPVAKPQRQTEKGILLLLDLVFFIASLVPPQMPVTWKWLFWFVCAVITVLLVEIHLERPKSAERKIWGATVTACIFVIGFYSLAYGQWRVEKAAALEGQLCSFRSFWGKCYTPFIPIIEIGGDSGSKMIYVGQENSVDFGVFARNAGLRIERGKNGMEISTPVLDRSGKKIASIEKNHWTVAAQPEIWDKNYTDNALEIKDSRGEVVLQLRFLPDRLQIAAEWRDQFGRGQEWAKCAAALDKPKTGCIIPWGDARTELQNEVAIEPIFQYPSSEHLGEFIKK
jgi:hypothetical protein